jgi:hypothetical protein
MTNPETPRSPLERLTEEYGLYFSPVEVREILKRVEMRAEEESEDNQPASQP